MSVAQKKEDLSSSTSSRLENDKALSGSDSINDSSEIQMEEKIRGFIELTKPRILTMVVVTTFLGYVLADPEYIYIPHLLLTLIGTALSCGGAGALNHYLERDTDCKMRRTQNRPIPAGIVSPAEALGFGIILVLAGTTLLVWQINTLTGFLALLTAFLYVLVYTPLKRLSWLNTMVGAIPGAIPPLGGWAAAADSLSLGAWVLFAIMFIWQHPHFYAIAWMYRDDYARGGLKMLSVVDPGGRRIFHHILVFSLLLIPVSLAPTIVGDLGWIYFLGALGLSLWMLAVSVKLFRSATLIDAKKLFHVTLMYFPLLLIFVAADMNFL